MAWIFCIILQHYFYVKLLGFLLHDSSVRARRSTACLSTPNCFPLCRRIACTLPIYHELESTMFNMLVAFLDIRAVIEHSLFHLAAGFTLDNNVVVFRWTKCTPQSDPIGIKLDPHKDLVLRQLSSLLN